LPHVLPAQAHARAPWLRPGPAALSALQASGARQRCAHSAEIRRRRAGVPAEALSAQRGRRVRKSRLRPEPRARTAGRALTRERAARQSGALSRAEAEEALAALAGEDVATGLRSAAWKERLAAMEALQARVAGLPPAELAAAGSGILQARLRRSSRCARICRRGRRRGE